MAKAGNSGTDVGHTRGDIVNSGGYIGNSGADNVIEEQI